MTKFVLADFVIKFLHKMQKTSLQEGSTLHLPPIDSIQNNFKSEIEQMPKKGANFSEECLLSSERLCQNEMEMIIIYTNLPQSVCPLNLG
jgi:hypothetical protein